MYDDLFRGAVELALEISHRISTHMPMSNKEATILAISAAGMVLAACAGVKLATDPEARAAFARQIRLWRYCKWCRFYNSQKPDECPRRDMDAPMCMSPEGGEMTVTIKPLALDKRGRGPTSRNASIELAQAAAEDADSVVIEAPDGRTVVKDKARADDVQLF